MANNKSSLQHYILITGQARLRNETIQKKFRRQVKGKNKKEKEDLGDPDHNNKG